MPPTPLLNLRPSHFSLTLSLLVFGCCQTPTWLQAQEPPVSPAQQLSTLNLSTPERPASFTIAQTPLPAREPAPPSTQPLPEPARPSAPPPVDLPGASPAPNGWPDSANPNSTDVPALFAVTHYQVTGSTVFSAADLDRVTQPFTTAARNRKLTFTELFLARDAITQLYVQKGYLTSGAYLPPQSFKAGIVEIRVLEGSLTDIQVTGTRRLPANYIRSRIALATTPPLNRDRLLEALQLLRLNPLIENLSAELAAGTQPGQSLLTVKVAEAKTFGAQITLDNARSPSVGTDRRQIQLSQANLLGWGDRLSLSYTNTNGSNAADFSYTLPVSPHDTTLSLNLGFSSSQVLEAPFNILDITSKSNYVELTLRHPLLRTPTREFALGLTATHRSSQSLLLGDIPFPAAGADDEGRTRLTALRFVQEYTQRSSRSVFALRSQFSVGLSAFNATVNDTAPDSRFLAWRGQAQWVRSLAPDTLLLLRGDVQLADRPLLPFEQFGLGGQDTIRGYRQDALLADRGLLAAAELRLPILRLPRAHTLLQIAPFFEIGTVGNAGDGAALDPNTLAAVGLGLRLQAGNHLTARFDWGIPLIDLSGEKRTWQEKGLYFSLVYTPF